MEGSGRADVQAQNIHQGDYRCYRRSPCLVLVRALRLGWLSPSEVRSLPVFGLARQISLCSSEERQELLQKVIAGT